MIFKIIGSILQGFGLLYFLIFSVAAGSLGLYELLSGQSSASTELGNVIVVLSFFGAVPLGLLLLGSLLIKNATGSSYFPNKIFEILGKLVIVPISIALSLSLALIMVPLMAYSFYKYRKGVETGIARFVRWSIEDWYITLTLYPILVFGVLFTLVL